MEKYQESFILNLKFFRSQKGLSQAQLAEKCNVSTGTIGNIECGVAKPSFDLLIRISETLDINPAQLFSSDSLPDAQHTLLDEHKILLDIYQTLNLHFEK